MTNVKLIDAQTFTDKDRWYIRLVYEYVDGDRKMHLRIFPKVEFPFHEYCCPSVNNLLMFSDYGSHSDGWSSVLMPKYAVQVYSKSDAEGIKRGVDVTAPMFDIIVGSPEPRKMTLAEIEKELGYSVAIVREEKMLKHKKVYICDHYGAVALQERYYFMDDSWTGPPNNWGRVHNMDLCPKCYQGYKILKEAAEDFVKEKMEGENES